MRLVGFGRDTEQERKAGQQAQSVEKHEALLNDGAIAPDLEFGVVVRYTAQAGESVPIELDGTERGQVAVVDLVPRQA